MQIGIIGAGGIAARHVQSLAQIEGVKIEAIFSPTLEKARALAEKSGPQTRSYSNYEDMLKRENLEALYICVPPFAHGEIELAAIEKKLPFFVEKPLAVELDTAEKIAVAVKESGLVTAVGYQWRYLNTTELAQVVLKERPARLVMGYWLDMLPPVAWWSKQNLSGGQVVEQTTHLIDLARYLAGEIKQVYALGGTFERQGKAVPEVDNVSTVSVQFENGAVGTFNSTCLLNGLYRKGLQLFADGVALELSYQDLIIEEGPGNRRHETASVDQFLLEDRAFLEAVSGQENRVRCDYGEALKTHRVTQAILRSRQEGRPVEVAKS